MRVVAVNLAADPAFDDPQQLLDAYHTLTGWADAMVAANASVRVVQRFAKDAAVARRGIQYVFVHDGARGTPEPWDVFPRVARIAVDDAPDVIHVNGLMFPGMVGELRRLAPHACIVVQDHSGAVPRLSLWPLSSSRWRRAFERVNACTFTARALADRWRPHFLPPDLRIIEIPEASTALRPMARDHARAITGMHGLPAVLWVGRLDRNKDPFTVLTGLEHVLPSLPGMHVTMVVPATDARDDVRERVMSSPMLRDRITLVGPIAHADMAAYYSAADIFVSGSHHEGSGYALIEAMACGAVPCVTDIPAFRALTAGCGVLWTAGDADAFAAAFASLMKRRLDEERAVVLRTFERSLTWNAIGRKTMAAYSGLLQAVRAAG